MNDKEMTSKVHHYIDKAAKRFKGLNTAMPLDVFAKMNVNEIKRLRKKIGELNSVITERDHTIDALMRQNKDLHDIIENNTNKEEAQQRDMIRSIRAEEMYQLLKDKIKHLIGENKRLTKLLKDNGYDIQRSIPDCIAADSEGIAMEQD